MKLIVFAPLFLAGCGFLSGPISPLITAARSGDVAKINELATSGADMNAPGGVNGWTPLMHAVHTNQAGSVEALLNKGAIVDLHAGGTTALVMAAGYGYTGIVKILLRHGADPRAAARNGQTALAAALEGSLDIDRTTAGQCQTETVEAIAESNPALRLAPDSSAIKAAEKAGCKEALALLSQ
jgi:ankyrin repeat protein